MAAEQILISALKKYLGQYVRCESNLELLDKRLSKVNAKFQNIMKSPVYSGMPHTPSPAKNKNEELVELRVDLLNEITERQQNSLRIMREVEGVISLLPDNSKGRQILEYRYLTCLTWEEIYDEMLMSHTPVDQIFKRTLEYLIELPEVRGKVEMFLSKE